jgi:hypothetical protein
MEKPSARSVEEAMSDALETKKIHTKKTEGPGAGCIDGHHCLVHTVAHENQATGPTGATGATGAGGPSESLGKLLKEMQAEAAVARKADAASLAAKKAGEVTDDLAIKAQEQRNKMAALAQRAKDNEEKEKRSRAKALAARKAAEAAALKRAAEQKKADAHLTRVRELTAQEKRARQRKEMLAAADTHLRGMLEKNKEAERVQDQAYEAHTETATGHMTNLAKVTEVKLKASREVERVQRKVRKEVQSYKEGELQVKEGSKKMSDAMRVQAQLKPSLEAALAVERDAIAAYKAVNAKKKAAQAKADAAKKEKESLREHRRPMLAEKAQVKKEIAAAITSQNLANQDLVEASKKLEVAQQKVEDYTDAERSSVLSARKETQKEDAAKRTVVQSNADKAVAVQVAATSGQLATKAAAAQTTAQDKLQALDSRHKVHSKTVTALKEQLRQEEAAAARAARDVAVKHVLGTSAENKKVADAKNQAEAAAEAAEVADKQSEKQQEDADVKALAKENASEARATAEKLASAAAKAGEEAEASKAQAQ